MTMANEEIREEIDLQTDKTDIGIVEISDEDLSGVSGGRYVCWWEAGPGFYTRVCMCK